MSERARSFPPVFDARARVLVLGTLPGRASLAAGEYYAHPRNGFWRLIGAAIGREDLPALAYPDRLAAIVAAGIALDDVMASAVRKGSLDAAIREAEHKELASLVAAMPKLRAVAFNGGTAARIGRALLRDLAIPAFVDLPSSSPAYAGMPLAEKARAWSELRRFLRCP